MTDKEKMAAALDCKVEDLVELTEDAVLALHRASSVKLIVLNADDVQNLLNASWNDAIKTVTTLLIMSHISTAELNETIERIQSLKK